MAQKTQYDYHNLSIKNNFRTSDPSSTTPVSSNYDDGGTYKNTTGEGATYAEQNSASKTFGRDSVYDTKGGSTNSGVNPKPPRKD